MDSSSSDDEYQPPVQVTNLGFDEQLADLQRAPNGVGVGIMVTTYTTRNRYEETIKNMRRSELTNLPLNFVCMIPVRIAEKVANCSLLVSWDTTVQQFFFRKWSTNRYLGGQNTFCSFLWYNKLIGLVSFYNEFRINS